MKNQKGKNESCFASSSWYSIYFSLDYCSCACENKCMQCVKAILVEVICQKWDMVIHYLLQKNKLTCQNKRRIKRYLLCPKLKRLHDWCNLIFYNKNKVVTFFETGYYRKSTEKSTQAGFDYTMVIRYTLQVLRGYEMFGKEKRRKLIYSSYRSIWSVKFWIQFPNIVSSIYIKGLAHLSVCLFIHNAL